MAEGRRVRVGIVGLGGNGRAHLECHSRLEQSEVVALCDRNEERLRRAGQEFGVETLYTGDEIYAHPGIEAIGIHTGDDDHRGPFIQAVQAGKHVLVEKPLANTEQDVLDMVAAADAADPPLKIQVGYVLRFNPLFEALHRAARDGRLGNIYYMEADYIHNLVHQVHKTDRPTDKNWYLEREHPMVGGGSHQLDLLRWLSGKQVVGVRAYANHFAFPAMRNDDCAVALYRFEDGSIAKVAALYGPRCQRPPVCNLRLYGTNGTVERDQIAVSASEEDVHPAFAPVPAESIEGHPFDNEIADWLNAILEDRPPRTGIHDGANSTLAALMAVRAVSEGREVSVPVLRAE